jgi:hypothetical protein
MDLIGPIYLTLSFIGQILAAEKVGAWSVRLPDAR